MQTVDILIFSGQSNMQGQSESLSENVVVDNAFEYRFLNDDLVPLKNPVGENIRFDKTAGEEVRSDTDIPKWLDEHALGSSCYGNTNLVPEFCRSYVKKAGRSAIAVHCAKGSTVISMWLKGSGLYDILKEKSLGAITCAKEAGYDIGHIYFIWLQGESDAICNVKKEEYKEKLISLYSSLKSDLGIERFGIIKVGHFTRDHRDEEIMKAQEEVCAEHTGFVMLTALAPEISLDTDYLHPYISGHYNAKGLEFLGREAGGKLGEGF